MRPLSPNRSAGQPANFYLEHFAARRTSATPLVRCGVSVARDKRGDGALTSGCPVDAFSTRRLFNRAMPSAETRTETIRNIFPPSRAQSEMRRVEAEASGRPVGAQIAQCSPGL